MIPDKTKQQGRGCLTSLPRNQIDDYLNRHHSTFNQPLKKADTEIYGEVLGGATRDQPKERGAII